MKTKYMAIFSLGRPQAEHARIDDVIGACCGRDMQKVMIGSKAVVYVFESEKPPHSLDFSRVLMNDDQSLFVVLDVGYASGAGFGGLRGWMNSHGIGRKSP